MGRLLTPIGANAAHLCIDMQRLFEPGAPWSTPWMPRVLPEITGLVRHAPVRTLFTRFIPPRSKDEARGAWKAYYEKWHCVTREEAADGLLDLVPSLAAYLPPAHLIDRQTYSAFGNGRLQSFLGEHGVDTLIVSGGETDVCVLASVLAAVDLGYRVIVAEDALCSASDESHDAMIDLYTRRFSLQIEAAPVDNILAAWRVSD
jgi:nicotinamidase-related amidase